MSDVIMYLSFCVVGYVIGVPLRKIKDKLGWVGTAQSASVHFTRSCYNRCHRAFIFIRI